MILASEGRAVYRERERKIRLPKDHILKGSFVLFMSCVCLALNSGRYDRFLFFMLS